MNRRDKQAKKKRKRAFAQECARYECAAVAAAAPEHEWDDAVSRAEENGVALESTCCCEVALSFTIAYADILCIDAGELPPSSGDVVWQRHERDLVLIHLGHHEFRMRVTRGMAGHWLEDAREAKYRAAADWAFEHHGELLEKLAP